MIDNKDVSGQYCPQNEHRGVKLVCSCPAYNPYTSQPVQVVNYYYCYISVLHATVNIPDQFTHTAHTDRHINIQ